jgi:hypothetical protein
MAPTRMVGMVVQVAGMLDRSNETKAENGSDWSYDAGRTGPGPFLEGVNVLFRREPELMPHSLRKYCTTRLQFQHRLPEIGIFA